MATDKLYTDKSAITAADLLNDRAVLFSDEQGIRLQRILTDRCTESYLEKWGKPESHAYQLYLAVEDIDHSRTKASHAKTNGICERFHKTLQDECYNLLFWEAIRGLVYPAMSRTCTPLIAASLANSRLGS